LTALYRRYLPMVWRYVYWRADCHRQVAEDVVSETFLAVVRQVYELDPEGGSVAAWLTAIARHKLIDYQRRTDRERRAAHNVQQRHQVDDCRDSPQSAAGAIETREQVVRAMCNLSDEERLMLEWKYVDRLAVREIAARLGRTEKAVESLLYRARRSFRAHFAGGDDVADGRAGV
jgi:RNA polymerase sigma-70 factor (ECF subfamily)